MSPPNLLNDHAHGKEGYNPGQISDLADWIIGQNDRCKTYASPSKQKMHNLLKLISI